MPVSKYDIRLALQQIRNEADENLVSQGAVRDIEVDENNVVVTLSTIPDTFAVTPSDIEKQLREQVVFIEDLTVTLEEHGPAKEPPPGSPNFDLQRSRPLKTVSTRIKKLRTKLGLLPTLVILTLVLVLLGGLGYEVVRFSTDDRSPPKKTKEMEETEKLFKRVRKLLVNDSKVRESLGVPIHATVARQVVKRDVVIFVIRLSGSKKRGEAYSELHLVAGRWKFVKLEVIPSQTGGKGFPVPVSTAQDG